MKAAVRDNRQAEELNKKLAQIERAFIADRMIALRLGLDKCRCW